MSSSLVSTFGLVGPYRAVEEAFASFEEGFEALEGLMVNEPDDRPLVSCSLKSRRMSFAAACHMGREARKAEGK